MQRVVRTCEHGAAEPGLGGLCGRHRRATGGHDHLFRLLAFLGCGRLGLLGSFVRRCFVRLGVRCIAAALGATLCFVRRLAAARRCFARLGVGGLAHPTHSPLAPLLLGVRCVTAARRVGGLPAATCFARFGTCGVRVAAGRRGRGRGLAVRGFGHLPLSWLTHRVRRYVALV